MTYSRWTPGCCCNGTEGDCNGSCSYRAIHGTYELSPGESFYDEPVAGNFRYRQALLSDQVEALVGNTKMKCMAGGTGTITDPYFVPYSSNKCPDLLKYYTSFGMLGFPGREFADYKGWLYESSGSSLTTPTRWFKITDPDNKIYYYVLFTNGFGSMYTTLEAVDYGDDFVNSPLIHFTPVTVRFKAVNISGASSNGTKTSATHPSDLRNINYGFYVEYNISVTSSVVFRNVGQFFNDQTTIREQDIVDPEGWLAYVKASSAKTIAFVREMILNSGSFSTSWNYIRSYPCDHATMTSKKWLKNGSCHVVKCRCPQALECHEGLGGSHYLTGPYFTLNGQNVIGGWRYSMDKNDEPVIEEADHVEVRSTYCNSTYCRNYTPPDYTYPVSSSEIPHNNE